MELVLRDVDEAPVALFDPTTGEVLNLAQTSREQLAAWYLHMLTWQASAAAAVRLGSQAFAALTDREASLSVQVDGHRISVPGGGHVFEVSKPALRKGLLGLVEEGLLSEQAADEACRPTGVNCPSCDTFIPDGGYKVSAAAIKNLRKVPRINAVIDACGEYLPATRPLKATRL